MSRTPRSVALVGLLTLSTSCSLLLKPEQNQCSTDDDCAGRGFAGATCASGVCVAAVSDAGSDAADAGPGGPWGCVGHVTWPDPDTSVPASATVKVLKMVGQSPFPGLAVDICPPLDVSCTGPIGQAVSAADGTLTLPVYKGFNGSLYAPAPSSFPDMAPMLFYLFPPPSGIETTARDGNLNIASVGELSSLGTLGGVTIKPGLGHIFLTVYDCNMNRTAGVSVKVDTIDPSTTTVYLSETGIPSKVLGETTKKGEGAIVNVPPGFVTLTATSTEAGKMFQQTVSVRADHITGVPVAPSP